MKLLTIIFIFSLAISCNSTNNLCSNSTKYLKRDIDTTKEYKLKGAYCVESISDTVLNSGDSSLVQLKVYSRITGRQINDGVIYFYGHDTISLMFDSKLYEKKIKAGNYEIEAWSIRFTGAKTRKMEVDKNKKITINFYLGATQEF